MVNKFNLCPYKHFQKAKTYRKKAKITAKKGQNYSKNTNFISKQPLVRADCPMFVPTP